ncbi:unnamed protein product [Rangifer tarandus platyrhynchus]|uniref:G-protein coupled receptors family 1 profile domain-containing protein n=1 Tax=Rangifer tarandus platyrhynchus TaxID=3082113 RepID=A0ABN8ZWR2_RANTA|nr:unnamed protein product [Rangifer tarandus platyrhynchus]
MCDVQGAGGGRGQGWWAPPREPPCSAVHHLHVHGGGNLAIFLLVGAHRRLQTPMYFFLYNLSFLEICFTTACVPKILAVFALRSGAISFSGCAVQMHFVFSLGCIEYFLLVAMAYDRYLAICLLRRYGSIMMPGLSGHLALGSWLRLLGHRRARGPHRPPLLL